MWAKKPEKPLLDPKTGDPVFKKHFAYNDDGRNKIGEYDKWKNLKPEEKKKSMSPLHGLGLVVCDFIPLTLASQLNFHVSINLSVVRSFILRPPLTSCAERPPAFA